jgi:hypothetical protein
VSKPTPMGTKGPALLAVPVVTRWLGWLTFWLRAEALAGTVTGAVTAGASSWRIARRAASRGRFVWERDMFDLHKGFTGWVEEVPDGENPPRYIWCRGSL